MIRKRNEKWKRETSERGRRRKIEGSWKEVGRKKISEDMCDFEGSGRRGVRKDFRKQNEL